ncbi:MAG: hypothetical protein KF752_08190 [Pirellulaceae bacterium]|nr:hypothetical protein [Pirellulaceae bacterium]
MKWISVVTALILAAGGWSNAFGQQPAAAVATAGGNTVWHRLGIPQAYTGIRDAVVNRRGNLPGLERKPPVLALADPKNLDPSKPEMIQAAAKIKQDQDLKKQKIKALKFLADVNCGCYNKDSKVEAAFLEALDDCDPDVRKQAIESLSEAAGKCTKCRTGCEITCCTEKILKKLDDIANGMEDGCYKEPDKEIRKAAQALFCKCPPPKCKPLDPPEELIAPPPAYPEELLEKREGVDESPDAEGSVGEADDNDSQSSRRRNSYRFSDQPVSATPPNSTATKTSLISAQISPAAPELVGIISNPEYLIECRTVSYNAHLGELVIQLPQALSLSVGWQVILVDQSGNASRAEVAVAGGRRLLLTLDDQGSMNVGVGDKLKMGAIENQ